MTQTSLQRQAPSPATSDKAGARSAQLSDYRVQAREHGAHSSMMQNSARATQFKQMQTLMHQHAAASTASAIPLQKKSAELRKPAKPVLQTKTWLTANVDRSPLVQRKTLAQTGWGEKLGVTETPDTHAIDDYTPLGLEPNAGSHANAKIYEDKVPLKRAGSRSDAMKKLATRSGNFGNKLSEFTATIVTETKATVLATIAPRDNTAAAATPAAAALANPTVARGPAAESKAPAANQATATGLTPKPKDNTAAAATPAAAVLANPIVARGPAAESKAPAANQATATGLTPKPKDSSAAAATPAAAVLANPIVARGPAPEIKETVALKGNFYSTSPNRNKIDETRLDPFCHSMIVKLPDDKYIKMLIQHTIGHDGYITKIEEGTKGKNESPDQVKTTATMVNGKAGTISAGSYTYNKTHEKTGAYSLSEMGGSKRFDAMTKLVGEGSRFMWVRENIENITDETEYSIDVTDYKKKDTQISIQFKDLWVTWNNWFGGKYNISNPYLNSVLQEHWAAFKEEKNSKREAIAVGDMFGTTKGEESVGKIKVTKSKNAAPAKK